MEKRYVLAALIVLLLFAANPIAAQRPDSSNFVAHLSGEEEVPQRETNGVGQTVFHSDRDETALEFMLMVANIENVVAAHIHLGPAGSNGPVVAFLYGSEPPAGGSIQGVIARGVITSGDLTGPLEGEDLSALLTAMRTGDAYVNVHTNDGVDPTNTGAGDFPGGEIRGQISSSGQ